MSARATNYFKVSVELPNGFGRIIDNLGHRDHAGPRILSWVFPFSGDPDHAFTEAVAQQLRLEALLPRKIEVQLSVYKPCDLFEEPVIGNLSRKVRKSDKIPPKLAERQDKQTRLDRKNGQLFDQLKVEMKKAGLS